MCRDMEDSGSADEYVFKLLLLGASGVGKTHLAMRFVKGGVLSNSEPTIGVDFASRVVRVDDATLVRLQIWDTAGVQRYRHHDLGKLYRHAVCAVLVYDVSDRRSFEALESWADELNATTGVNTSRMVLMVVGNKSDLSPRAVARPEGEAFAHQHGYLYAETSAAKNEHVTELFETAAAAILSRLVPAAHGGDNSSDEGGIATPDDTSLPAPTGTEAAAHSVSPPAKHEGAPGFDGETRGRTNSRPPAPTPTGESLAVATPVVVYGAAASVSPPAAGASPVAPPSRQEAPTSTLAQPPADASTTSTRPATANAGTPAAATHDDVDSLAPRRNKDKDSCQCCTVQ